MTPQRQRIANLRRELRNAKLDKYPAHVIVRLQDLLKQAEQDLRNSREPGESRTVAEIDEENEIENE